MFSNIQDGNSKLLTIWSTTWKLNENLEEKPYNNQGTYYILIFPTVLYSKSIKLIGSYYKSIFMYIYM